MTNFVGSNGTLTRFAMEKSNPSGGVSEDITLTLVRATISIAIGILQMGKGYSEIITLLQQIKKTRNLSDKQKESRSIRISESKTGITRLFPLVF